MVKDGYICAMRVLVLLMRELIMLIDNGPEFLH